ncbi:hypothetical protein P4233_09725 [Pseudomonas aeruginosa]|nr:hypothetical protein [Pseudomonas aeruginosa]
MWIDALLEDDGRCNWRDGTTAFTYLGRRSPTTICYWNGFHRRSEKISTRRSSVSATSSPRLGAATRLGAQAVVTQASSAIPMMPLYLSRCCSR